MNVCVRSQDTSIRSPVQLYLSRSRQPAFSHFTFELQFFFFLLLARPKKGGFGRRDGTEIAMQIFSFSPLFAGCVCTGTCEKKGKRKGSRFAADFSFLFFRDLPVGWLWFSACMRKLEIKSDLTPGDPQPPPPPPPKAKSHPKRKEEGGGGGSSLSPGRNKRDGGRKKFCKIKGKKERRRRGPPSSSCPSPLLNPKGEFFLSLFGMHS